MPDAPISILPEASGGGSPTSPVSILSEASGGGSPTSPVSILGEASGGGSPTSPVSILGEASGGGSPTSPVSILGEASGGGSPTSPVSILGEASGGGSPTSPVSVLNVATDDLYPNFYETNFPNANNDIRFEQVNPAITPSVKFVGNPSVGAAPVSIQIDASPEQVVVIVAMVVGLTTTTANQVITAINAHPAASALMRASAKTGNTGASAIGDFSSMITRKTLTGGGLPSPVSVLP